MAMSSTSAACYRFSCAEPLEPERQDVLDLLLEVRSALSAGEIEERTKHSAAAGTPLAEALRASAKVDALPDGRFRYKVLAWAVSACGSIHGLTKSAGSWHMLCLARASLKDRRRSAGGDALVWAAAQRGTLH